MGAFVLRVLAACSRTQKVSELMKLNWHTINEIMRCGVERGLLRREEQALPHLGIDEKSIAKGHSYASVLADIDVVRSRCGRGAHACSIRGAVGHAQRNPAHWGRGHRNGYVVPL